MITTNANLTGAITSKGKSKKMIAYEKARVKHKKALLDFFILCRQEQETSRKLHNMVNGVDPCSAHSSTFVKPIIKLMARKKNIK